jgi:type II secretory pathway component PulC
VFILLADRYVNLLNLALVGLLAIFLGLSIEDVYNFHVASEVVPVAHDNAGLPPSRSPTALRTRNFYDAITERDIFNLAPAPKAPVENADLHIKLLGTSQLTRGKPFAIIEDQAGNQLLFQAGDAIPGVGRLLQVDQDRVVVLHNGHQVASEIPPASESLSEITVPPPRNLVVQGGRKILIPGF